MRTPWAIARLAAVLLMLAAAQAVQAQATSLACPLPARAEVVDELFGVQVSDPYRWMELPEASRSPTSARPCRPAEHLGMRAY